MDRKIDAVMIDTSAYHKKQCDFEGITNSIIPMLLQLLEANDITLLTHPVLEKEIKKHIGESELVARIKNFQMSLKKYKWQLQMIGLSFEELTDKLEKLEMEARLNKSFDSFYQFATSVPFVDAKEVFIDYFNARPPFSSTGNKKAEFPDAFILKGIEEYCKENPDLTVLVISDDTDWIRTLENNKQIVIKDSLETAMVFLWEQLDDKTNLYEMLISKIDLEIRAEIEAAAMSEAFYVDMIDSSEEVEAEVNNISVISLGEEIVPLEVTPNSVLLQITTTLSADGELEFLDESRSVWDREDRCYYFWVYTHLNFKKALAYVECEIRIDFSDAGTLSEVNLSYTKLLNKSDIRLNLDEAEIEEKVNRDSPEDYDIES